MNGKDKNFVSGPDSSRTFKRGQKVKWINGCGEWFGAVQFVHKDWVFVRGPNGSDQTFRLDDKNLQAGRSA